MKKDLDTRFKEAYKLAWESNIKLPPDIQLKFYAHYKQATKGNQYVRSKGEEELRSAFKQHAWFQLNHLTEDEAKKEYIKLVKKYIK